MSVKRYKFAYKFADQFTIDESYVLASDYDALDRDTRKRYDEVAADALRLKAENDALARRLEEAEAKLAIWEAACTGKHGSQVSCGEMAIALCRPESAGAPVDRTDERCSCKPLAVRGKATDLEVYCPQCGKVFRGAADNGTD